MEKPPFSSILITGASSGIGEAVALRLAAPGVHLAITGRNAARLGEVAAALRRKGAEVLAETVDVTDPGAMQSFVDRAEARAPLDLVIGNAGISGGFSPFADDSTVRDIFEVNILGVVNTVLPAVRAMRRRRAGRIAIVSSIAGYRGLPTAPTYSASKVGIKAWGDAMRPKFAKDGIGLTMICPGFVESRITASNDFPMPFMMPADKAAGIVVGGLIAGKREIAFPWQTVWFLKTLALLPGPLFDWIMSRAPQKR